MAPDLYAPVLAGNGGFTTALGGAPVSALNPAAGGGAQRIVFDAGYLAISAFGMGGGIGSAAELGALFPTKYAVLGASFRFLHSPYDEFPIGATFGGNLNVAKEIYPGLSLGLGFNYGFGTDWTASGDLGFRYNLGSLGFLKDFTLAFVMRSLGKSWIPTAFTPAAGVAFDLIHLEGAGDKPDPFKLGIAADIAAPGFKNMLIKVGASATIAEMITLAASTNFNIRDIADGTRPSLLPSIGLTANFALQSGGKRLAGGRLPSDGDLALSLVEKPLYKDIFAIGAGASWSVGVLDKKPPVITVEYPETQWISPNNDGKADVLEFPVSITDQRFVAEWKLEISDDSGTVVRTYRNKERRPETQGVRNFFSRLIEAQAGVEVAPTLRWDGIFDSGDIAPDGVYSFVITASDDNGNTASTSTYEVVVDNDPPQVTVEELAEAAKIFSPDGDGNKDTITITQTGSPEDLWDAGIYNAEGIKVKSFDVTHGQPQAIIWDGTDDEGHIVIDGVYGYRINATDRALNTGNAALDNMIVSTIQPRVNLLIEDAYFSPNGDGIKDTLALNAGVPVKEGIVSWSLVIRDSAGRARRLISGGVQAPDRIDYDGRDDSGAILSEGVYQADLSINYRNGYVSTASSPAFTLDITAPRASVQTEYAAFSPNNDGNQDEMIFRQEGSNEVSWIGEIRRAQGNAADQPVRTIRGSGTPSPRSTWDGLTDAGALAPDGDYTYYLYSTDQAGNTGRSNEVPFTLSTADTPVLLSTDLRAFSPNNDRVKDTINIIPQLQVNTGINSWKLDILNASGMVVQTVTGQSSVPASIPWNGRNTAGNVVPDGNYTARMEVRYAMGNQPVAQTRVFAVDTTEPKGQISTPFTLFSPNGDGIRDYIPIRILTEADDEWEAAITDSRGTVVQSWNWRGTAPDTIPWDGTDRAGNNVADGTYRLALTSTDEAGNNTRLTLDNIVVDARIPRAFLTSSLSAIAPKGGPSAEALRFNIILNPREGIETWTLELQDESGVVRRRFPAAGTSPAAAPPESIGWNGYDDGGTLREGKFIPHLTVSYLKGDVVSVSAAPITVDVSGPVLSFNSQPEYFSPDNDGVDDELIINLGAQDISPIASWSLEIREPRPPYQLFYRIEGRGSPAERTIWDGRSSKGELVQAATDYPCTFKAEDVLGNASSMEGTIGVDVLVIRDGDILRIQVPSIIFRENEADFIGLPADVVENNNRVLRRVAEILNKFRDYRVQVEGHANPVLRTAAEETNELQPLSERRARATVEFLAGFGVNRNRLSAIGMGGKRPVVRYEDHDNWWKNRRVEFILIK
jgi:flagellar hook assembly protein FlgD